MKIRKKCKNPLEKYIKVLQNILLKDLPKRDVEIQGNHEHEEKHVVDNKSHTRSMSSQLERINIESQNHNHEFSIQYPHR